MNYVTNVERPDGRVCRVTVQANGVSLTFAKGRDGKPIEVSRSRPAMVYTGAELYIPRAQYAGLIRQVRGVFGGKNAAV